MLDGELHHRDCDVPVDLDDLAQLVVVEENP